MLIAIRLFFISFLFIGINSCTQLPFGDGELTDITKTTAKKILESQLKEFVLKSAPILPNTEASFPAFDKIPGAEFKSDLKNQPKWNYNEKGEMILNPGDYVIPVWTFCLQTNAQSPKGQIYTLNKLKGSAANVIQRLNLRALTKYSSNDVQMLIWNLQAGFSYDELKQHQQKIIDDVAVEFKSDLQKSFYRQLEEKWNRVSEKSHGLVPSLSEASDEFINQLGSVGEAITDIRSTRQKILSAKGNYDDLRRSIDTRRIQQKNKLTQWSQISERVYARFVTKGHFQEAGHLQVRVMPASRQAAGVSQAETATFDVSALVADSESANVQPLSLAPLVGIGGVAVTPSLSTPWTAAAVLAAMLAAKVVDWDAFFDLVGEASKWVDQAVKDMIKHGQDMLNHIHDRLDEQKKENKIVSGKDLIKPGKDRKARIYEKTGDDQTLEEDFDKLPGEKSVSEDGHEIKTFPNGDKAVKRPAKDGKEPTLEIQAGDGSKETSKTRYKK